MATVKLTKNELRDQQRRLAQLEKYLPTLQLKKAMLQAEVHEAKREIEERRGELDTTFAAVEEFSSLFSVKLPVDPTEAAKISSIERSYENIAGVEVPIFENALFQEVSYALFDSPPWLDGAIKGLKDLARAGARLKVAEEKREALSRELRLVSIRVNLFEKILIPRAKKTIKAIKIFLGDQDLASVSRAKVAKALLKGEHA